MQKITPFLWFDSQAEEAAHFYVSIFPNSKVGTITRYSEAVSEVAGQPAGTALTVNFELNGQEFVGLNGGPMFKFSEAISFMIPCENQDEIDHYWGKLTEGGEPSMCGWLKDKYGVSWQVAPTIMEKYLSGPDKEACDRAMKAMMQMTKMDIPALERAYKGV